MKEFVYIIERWNGSSWIIERVTSDFKCMEKYKDAPDFIVSEWEVEV